MFYKKKLLPTNVTVEEINHEIARIKGRNNILNIVKTILFSLTVVAAIAVLLTILLFPVLQVNGNSMEPFLNNGDIIIALKPKKLVKRGDIIAFYYNDKVLLKRVIGIAGDKIDMDEDGNVYVNGIYLDEPYISRKSSGICDIEFPVEVSENAYFVLGDLRSVSIDSRSSDVGLIYDERVIGKTVFRLWPPEQFGLVDYGAVEGAVAYEETTAKQNKNHSAAAKSEANTEPYAAVSINCDFYLSAFPIPNCGANTDR